VVAVENLDPRVAETVRPNRRDQRIRVDTRGCGRAVPSMTAWSSRADGQNAARELRRDGRARSPLDRPLTRPT
jgi:hypothetical protein